jgi:hypothetical protein
MLITKRFDRSAVVPLLAALPLLLSAGVAQAHFKLTKPASWIVESDLGDPQKAGPCGPEGSGGMMTDEITTVEAGSMLEVEYVETIHHPGWFRISLDQDRSKFEDIEFPSASNCNYDMSTVPEEPHGNVLADGLAKDENLGGSNRTFKEMIKIPDTPCEKCTLQVIQVMADAIHSPPGCIYYHCADLKIVAAAGGSAGAAAPSGAAGAASGGSGGSSAGGAPASAAAGTGGSASATTPASAAAGASGSASKPTTSPSTTPASSGSAGTTGARADSATGTAGKPATPSSASAGTAAAATKAEPTTTVDDAATAEQGGCAVTQPGGRSGLASCALLSVVGVLFGARRRQRARA